MDAAQITILVIVAIISLLFIKYKITGSVMAEFRFMGRILDRGYEYFAVTACLGALVSVCCSGLIIYAFVMPAEGTDIITVTGLTKTRGSHNSTTYGINGLSRRERVGKWYGVSYGFHQTVQVGDKVEVTLSRIFHDWRDVRVLRAGRAIRAEKEREWPALIFAVLFCLPMSSFVLYPRLKNTRILGSLAYSGILLFELLPVAILIYR